MGIRDLLRGLMTRPASPAPRGALQDLGAGISINTPEELEAYLRDGSTAASGVAVTPTTSLRVAAVYACVRIITGAVSTMPLHIKRRIDDKTREDADDLLIWQTLRRRPNRWQTPSQFRRQLQGDILLEGNGYAMKIRDVAGPTRGQTRELIPLIAPRVSVKQRPDLSLEYRYRRQTDNREIVLQQDDVFHVVAMTLDGVRGVTPITFARETIGLSLAMEKHGAAMFRNGARVSGLLSHPNTLGKEGLDNLRDSLEEFRAGGEKEGKDLILEEGMTYERMALTAEDAQWIESRKFSRGDIAMFFGVPPHMIGDTEKSTSWGSGIEQQSIGFQTYTLEDHLTAWEQSIDRDLIIAPDVYARFNRAALVRGDLKTRGEFYVKMRQQGIMNPDEIRAKEDMNPREDGRGGEYAEPPNAPGGAAAEPTQTGEATG